MSLHCPQNQQQQAATAAAAAHCHTQHKQQNNFPHLINRHLARNKGTLMLPVMVSSKGPESDSWHTIWKLIDRRRGEAYSIVRNERWMMHFLSFLWPDLYVWWDPSMSTAEQNSYLVVVSHTHTKSFNPDVMASISLASCFFLCVFLYLVLLTPRWMSKLTLVFSWLCKKQSCSAIDYILFGVKPVSTHSIGMGLAQVEESWPWPHTHWTCTCDLCRFC